jgi:hypothetical protein
MRIPIAILFLLIIKVTYSQEKIDGEFVFKTQLFLEKKVVKGVSGFEGKSRHHLSFFLDKVDLTLDTLSSKGFDDRYLFLRLSTTGGINYKNDAIRSDSSFALLIESGCDEYVLALNKFNGKSYRLKGFQGNDFFSLFFDINRDLKRENKGSLSLKLYRKNSSVDLLDFDCLYTAFKSGEFNTEKYPCLKSCENAMSKVR